MEYEPDVSLPYQYAKEEQNDKNVKRNRVERKLNIKRRSSNNCKKQVFTNDLSSESNDILSTSDNTFNSSHVNCSCCNDNFGEEMYECCTCHRKYHEYCHIPKIILRSEERKKTWRCTMCGDMNTISMDLVEDGDPENISVGTVGRKIAERILMELYCYTSKKDFFREGPNTDDVNSFRRYYKNTNYAVTLNYVRDCLTNKINYKLSEVMEDLKLVLVNAMLYFEVGEPNFNLAKKLLTRLHSVYHSWIMYPSKISSGL